MLPTSLKDCIDKINNDEPIFDSLHEEGMKIKRMEFIGAYHILKSVIEELHEENTITDLVCKMAVSENDGTYILYIGFDGFSGTNEEWDIFNETDSLIEDLSCIIQSSNCRDFGELYENDLKFNFYKDPLPNLDNLILGSKNKAEYHAALLELELANEKSTSKKAKI